MDKKIKIGLVCLLASLFGVTSFFVYGKNPENIVSETKNIETDKTITPKTLYTGKVPILLYHSIGPKETRWTRSVLNFKKDLQWLYDNGYVLFSIEDFADSDYADIPEGKKPVVLTFDDGKPSQFRFLNNGSTDPDCAIGIMDDFYKQHPDFGRAAAFYINADPFGQPKSVAEKLRYLVSTGRQIGFHTLGHSNMRAMSPEQNREILFKQAEYFKKILPAGTRVDTLAYPHGLTPKGGLKEISSGEKNGISYNIKLGLLIGSTPASQLNEKSDAYRTPRVQAIDEEWLRHFRKSE